MRKSVAVQGAVILLLALVASLVWYAAWREDRRGLLTVSFLNVGQGDSVFIDAPSGKQVLIDGGPDSSVLRRLSAVMPWWDRSIDIVVPTHPDKDHISGLIDVLRRYRTELILQSSVVGTTTEWALLEKTIADATSRKARVMTAQRGQVVELGKGVRMEILSPDRPLPHADTNEACVVARITYGKTAFMLPCDAPQGVEEYLVYLDGASLKSDVLKAGHHGSRTSSSPLFVGYVDPAYAVYSRSCDNRYGFPHSETVATFARFKIPTLDTCEDGTITFVSDGETVSRR